MAKIAPADWIVLVGDGGPAIRAADAECRLRVLSDPTSFREALASGRSRVAILVDQPATERDEELALRERARRPTLRIVLLTDGHDVGHRLEALRRGFDEAWPVDLDPDELVGRLEILTARATAHRGAAVPVAPDVVLDPGAHAVRRDGELIHLRPKEYQLLAVLAAHPGRAYTRRQLLDLVWGRAHQGDPRTVDVHVRWLRAKLEPVPSAPVHLVTVRGIGYRLDPAGR